MTDNRRPPYPANPITNRQIVIGLILIFGSIALFAFAGPLMVSGWPRP